MSLSPKNYSLSFAERPGYFYAKVSAPSIDRQTAIAYLSEVAEKCRSIHCSKLMLERDIPVMLPDADLFFTTNDFLSMIKPVKVAFVNPHASIHDEMQFAMVIGTNRGADFSLHKTAERAEKWLLQP